MKKAIAFGLFVISLLLGASFVILGTTMMSETYIWIGMIVFAIGIINLAVKVTIPERRVHYVPIRPVRAKPKRKPAKRKSKRKKK